MVYFLGSEYPLSGIVAYLVLFGFTLFILRVENTDTHCPNFSASKEECEAQGGMSFTGTKPSEGDTCTELIAKIRKGSKAESESIKWRKSLVLAVGIMAAVFFLLVTPGGLPDWKLFYLATLIGFVVLFGVFDYYSYHVFGISEKWIGESLDLLEKKCLSADSEDRSSGNFQNQEW